MKEPSLKCVDMVVSELTSTIRKCSEKVKKRKTPRKVNAHPLPTHIGAHTTGPLASPGREEGCGDALKEGSHLQAAVQVQSSGSGAVGISWWAL